MFHVQRKNHDSEQDLIGSIGRRVRGPNAFDGVPGQKARLGSVTVVVIRGFENVPLVDAVFFGVEIEGVEGVREGAPVDLVRAISAKPRLLTQNTLRIKRRVCFGDGTERAIEKGRREGEGASGGWEGEDIPRAYYHMAHERC